jgi:predicted amidophosphoribosyltransferase
MCTAAASVASRDLARFLPAALDLAVPSRCLACGERLVAELHAGGVCRACWHAVPELAAERCPVCSEPTPGAVEPWPCGRCFAAPPAFAALRAAAPYAGSARAILIAFKFRGADYLAGHLARLVIERCGSQDRTGDGFDEVAPVPGGPLARWRRDHAALSLAEAVAHGLGLPFAEARLRKRRVTKRQSGLPADRRAANVRGAFAASHPAERVLLVDDVATSGATARECARALVRAGAKRVEVWCFARASREDSLGLGGAAA